MLTIVNACNMQLQLDYRDYKPSTRYKQKQDLKVDTAEHLRMATTTGHIAR